jgi:outer membrane protein assembly factor BamA
MLIRQPVHKTWASEVCLNECCLNYFRWKAKLAANVTAGVFLFLYAVASCGQLALQGPQSVYNGQTVGAIDLVGNPHRNLEPFRPLIQQTTGEPYSQSKVEASIAALERSGQFPEVEVTVVPDPLGLRLNFLLEPAYYLGMVDFPGATKAFSYARLLQVTDLQEEDPYATARVAASEKALQEFFRRNGYFQAVIHSEPSIDDAHQLVSVTFSVELGKQARIDNVTLQGPDAQENTRLIRSVRSLRAHLTGGLLKRGKTYDPARITAASKLMKRALSRQGRLASSVKENPPQYHPETNRVDVSFKLDLGPQVTVRVAGARLSAIPFLSGREIKKLIPVYSEGTIDRDLVNEGQQNLIDHFQKNGYFNVKVKTTFEKQPERILLVYQIEKGAKHKVDRIVFQGNHQISTHDLLAVLAVEKAHFWFWSHGKVSEKLARQSADNLEGLYRDRGYEEAKVSPQIVVHEPKIEVIFDIQEGAPTMVQKVGVVGNDHVPLAQLTGPGGLALRSGAPFSPRKFADDRNRISAAYLNRGYLTAEVRSTLKRDPQDPHRVEVIYNVAEHQMVRAADVIYLGQEHTRTSLIRKTAKLSDEAAIKRGDLLQAESRLYDLNIFDWSSVTPRKPITDQTEESILVRNHEAKRNEITYGFGFEVSHRGGNVPTGTVAVPGGPVIGIGNNQIAPSQATFASPLGSIEFTRRNMRGMAETIKASLVLSQLDQRALATYGQPHFLGLQWSSLTSLTLEHTSENPLFSATLGDASFQLEHRLNLKNNTRLQVRYDFNKTVLSHLLVPELVLPQDMNVHLSTFSGTLLRDTRDKPLDAHRGSFSTVNLGITPTSLGSSANFAKLAGQYAFYRQVHSIVFAESVRLGLAKAFANSFVPTSQLYFSGGGSSLRGFAIDEAGPQRIVPFCDVLEQQTGCVNVPVPVGGRGLFIFNSEVRFPLHINKALGGVIFYDGGNVYSAINLPNFVNNFSNTVGIGLRYATPIGPIRVDVGRNLNPVPGFSATQYYITLGQAF